MPVLADSNTCCKALPLPNAVTCCMATAAAMLQQQMLQCCCHMLQCCCPHLAKLFCCTSSLLFCPLPPINSCLQTIIFLNSNLSKGYHCSCSCHCHQLFGAVTCCKSLPLPVPDAIACCKATANATPCNSCAAMLPPQAVTLLPLTLHTILLTVTCHCNILFLTSTLCSLHHGHDGVIIIWFCKRV